MKIIIRCSNCEDAISTVSSSYSEDSDTLTIYTRSCECNVAYTDDDIETIKQETYDKGFEDGKKEGCKETITKDANWEDGYNQGFNEGVTSVEKETIS